jgi:hypothetical protein
MKRLSTRAQQVVPVVLAAVTIVAVLTINPIPSDGSDADGSIDVGDTSKSGDLAGPQATRGSTGHTSAPVRSD